MAATFWSLRLRDGELLVGRSGVPIDRFLDGLRTTVFIEDRTDIDRVGAGTLAVALGRIAGRSYSAVDRFAARLAARGAAGLLVHRRSFDGSSNKPSTLDGGFPVFEVPARVEWPEVLQHVLRIDGVFKDRVDPERRRREMLVQLIECFGRVTLSPEDASVIGIDLERPTNVVVLAPRSGALSAQAARSLEETIAIEAMEVDPQATTFSLNEVVVVVGSEPTTGHLGERLLAVARRSAPGTHIVAGLGGAYAGTEGIFRSFREARWSARVGRFVDPAREVISYRDIGSYAWLEPIDLVVNGEAVADIERIIDHDRKNGTRLLETLQVFLETRRSQEAAARLFVHRNTLRYRLESIRKLTGMDVQEHEARLIMELQLRLARVRGLLEPRDPEPV